MVLEPPYCDHCGAGTTSRKQRYCDACTREGLPGPQHLGVVAKAVVIGAAERAIAYWERKERVAETAVDRGYAQGQAAFFKEQLAKLRTN